MEKVKAGLRLTFLRRSRSCLREKRKSPNPGAGVHRAPDRPECGDTRHSHACASEERTDHRDMAFLHPVVLVRSCRSAMQRDHGMDDDVRCENGGCRGGLSSLVRGSALPSRPNCPLASRTCVRMAVWAQSTRADNKEFRASLLCPEGMPFSPTSTRV